MKRFGDVYIAIADTSIPNGLVLHYEISAIDRATLPCVHITAIAFSSKHHVGIVAIEVGVCTFRIQRDPHIAGADTRIA